MPDSQPKDRSEEIRDIWQDKNYQFFYRILGGIILVGIGVWIGFEWFQSKSDRTSYIINLFTSILSIAVTVFVIDLLNRRRDEKRSDAELKEQLIIQMGSQDNALVEQAVKRIIAKGWHKDGSLRGQKFVSANLEGIRLNEFDLVGANFHHANLRHAKITKTNLSGSEFGMAVLESAHIITTNLSNSVFNAADFRNAIVSYCELSGSSLLNTKLQNCDLHESNLENVMYFKTIEDENTIMPDNSLFVRSNMEYNRFVDRNHKNFWRSNIPLSPAFQNKKRSNQTLQNYVYR